MGRRKIGCPEKSTNQRKTWQYSPFLPLQKSVFSSLTEDSNSPDLRSGRISARVLLLPSHGFPQWLSFDPALSRFGAALSRTVLSSRSILFSPYPAEHRGKIQLHIFVIRLLLSYRSRAEKSTVFCSSFRAKGSPKKRNRRKAPEWVERQAAAKSGSPM